jgi:hypothetical protein
VQRHVDLGNNSSVGTSGGRDGYVVHLSGGPSEKDKFASTREEDENNTIHHNHNNNPDMTVVSGQLTNVRRTDSVRSLFATSLSDAIIAEVGCFECAGFCGKFKYKFSSVFCLGSL